MVNLMTEYEKLKNEINHFINVINIYEQSIMGIPNVLTNLFEIQIISSPEVLTELDFLLQIKDKDSFEAIVKIMKSNSILMLYNLVESTIRVSMLEYYSTLNDKQMSFSQAIESIQKLWVKNYLNQINSNELNQTVFDMILNVIDDNYSVAIEKESFHLSGNADVKEMKKILETHGITYNNDSFRDYGGALLTIKNKRNYLAHGNISFEDNGKGFSIQDIIELKDKTYQCLDYFISLINSAISNHKFMSEDLL